VLTSGAAPSTLTVSVKALECKFLAHCLTGDKIDAVGGFNVQRIGADAQGIEAELTHVAGPGMRLHLCLRA
jgi:hypothetical protein